MTKGTLHRWVSRWATLWDVLRYPLVDGGPSRRRLAWMIVSGASDRQVHAYLDEFTPPMRWEAVDVFLEVSTREGLLEASVREDGQTAYRMTPYALGLDDAQRELVFDAGLRRLIKELEAAG